MVQPSTFAHASAPGVKRSGALVWWIVNDMHYIWKGDEAYAVCVWPAAQTCAASLYLQGLCHRRSYDFRYTRGALIGVTASCHFQVSHINGVMCVCVGGGYISPSPENV